VEPSLFLRNHLSGSGLCVLPQTGHTINLEEPDLFNQMVSAFLSAVEHDAWPVSPAGTGSTFMWD
jgi:proline iminopeptidase